MKLENIGKAYELKEKYDSLMHKLNYLDKHKMSYVRIYFHNTGYLELYDEVKESIKNATKQN